MEAAGLVWFHVAKLGNKRSGHAVIVLEYVLLALLVSRLPKLVRATVQGFRKA
jgi:hypothetical protein